MKEKNWTGTLLSFASRCRGKMILSVICAVISVFGGLVPYFGVYKIIILFIEAQPTGGQILFWAAVSLGGHMVKILFHTISTILSHISAYTVLENIRLRIAEKLMHAPLGTVLNETVGKMKNIIIDRVETIEIPLAHVIPELFSNLLLPIAVFVYLCTIDWRMALAALVTVPIAGISVVLMMRNFNKQYNDYMEASNHVNSVIVEYTEGIEVIKAFNQSTTSYEKFSKAVNAFKDYTLEWFNSTWGMMNFTVAVLPSSLLGTVPIGMALYLNGSLTPAAFTMCIILSLGIVAPLMKFSIFVNDAKAMEYAIKDADKLLNLPALRNEKTPVTLSNYDVTFNNVRFSYNEKQKDHVLSDVSINMPQNSFSALIGPSGGGKSTMARLIARFWDVNSGSITIGGVDIRQIPLSQLLKIVSFVTQDNFLFNCSLKENIRLGNPKATDEEVYEAAKAAKCDTFIARLDKGYDTPAGEAGKRLSGGEKQRIAIARAILKNAPIVILDEASAFIDPENEEKIQKSISALVKDKTLLVIAHRLSTVKNAGQIILLDKGQVVQTGTHEALLNTNSLYANMWKAHINAKSWTAAGGHAREVIKHA